MFIISSSFFKQEEPNIKARRLKKMFNFNEKYIKNLEELPEKRHAGCMHTNWEIHTGNHKREKRKTQRG